MAQAKLQLSRTTMKTSDGSWAICPLTGSTFIDPVVDHEGNTYEREAILEWLKQNSTSPITRNPLAEHQLFPNRALKDLLDVDSSSLPSTVNSSPLPSDNEDSDNNDNDNDNTLLDDLASKTTKTVGQSNGLSLVRIQVPDDASERHAPASIVCVIDVSYSMDGAATTQEDQEGNSGLSLLDIVKHATCTVIETLGPRDKLAIVTYADSAVTELPFVTMTPENKQRARQIVESLRTCGSTNLWSGLLQAMELDNEQTTDVFLLTDGEPNIHPPRGELETFRRYKNKLSRWNCRISTFGFGYNLDSRLLNDISIEGDGQYCFIPDSSFVGTVFINATSNVLSSVPNGPKIQDVLRGLSVKSVCYGQTLELFINDETVSTTEESTSSITRIDIEIARLRNRLVSMIRGAEERFAKNEPEALTSAQSDCQRLIEQFNMVITDCEDNDNQSNLHAMKEDLTGQITEAYSRQDWHSKWGRHYLLSLARAHELQRCTNFKDPGLQVYATKKFSLIRDMSEDVFCKLPPPKPSRRQNNANYQPVTSMSSYYNASAGCLAKGNVRLADGRYIPVSSVRSGDVLQTHSGPATVRCVVSTRCVNGIEELVELEGGVLVTPWHPVKTKGTDSWNFPADLGTAKLYSCDMVYNFVLENGASVPIGPLEAISLGHGIVNDPVAKHEYFGTSKVIQDLCKMVGWDQGFIQLGSNPGRRDPESGLIVSFVQQIESDAKPDSLNTEKNHPVPPKRACAKLSA
mmetsp:Transcript_16732/g.23617  ORF Transcript_16732/g.23617 Transcript_16732/m.23617 type:complete len:746 (+) Transcript_16732:3-2240(+)